MFLPRFNFPEEAFSRIGSKVAKTCSCENFFHEKYLIREKKRESLGVGTKILATFLINIFFLVYYVNIQPSPYKTRMEYFKIKIRLIRET